jgi:solute carrier family 35 protein F5
MAITLSSDYFYAVAMLKTTPLLVTVGLSLTIPIAVLGDFIRNRPTHGLVIGGALLVVLSFIALGLEDPKIHEEVVESGVEP